MNIRLLSTLECAYNCRHRGSDFPVLLFFGCRFEFFDFIVQIQCVYQYPEKSHTIKKNNKNTIDVQPLGDRMSMVFSFGPSGRIRTCGILLPKQARYQLRYTRIFSFCHYTMAEGKIEVFSVCGQTCGQNGFSGQYTDPAGSRKLPCSKAFRVSAFTILDGDRRTPKAGALPTALHPVFA